MIRSCSAWIVSTMSRIRPVRLALSAASSADSPVSPSCFDGIGGRQVQDLIVDAHHGPAAGLDVTAPPDVGGRGRGGQVERPRRVGAPVHEQLLVVAGIVVNADPADVPALAVVEIEPAEAQAVLRRVELGELLGVHDAECLALGPGLMRPARLPQHLRQPARGAIPQLIEPAVEHGDVLLLAPDFIG